MPTDVEYVKRHFPEPFLASMFGSLWKDISEAGLEPAAMVEQRQISVDRIPGSWIREDRLPWNGLFAVTAQLHDRYDVCDICQEFVRVPFPSC